MTISTPCRRISVLRSSLSGRFKPAALVVRRPVVVICVWVGITAWSVLTLPALHDVFVASPPASLPSDAPSMVADRAMDRAFSGSKSPDIVLLVLTDPNGLNPGDETAYGRVVSRLATTTPIVTTTSPDGAPAPRPSDRMISADNKSWILPLTIAGEPGSPTANAAYRQMVSNVQGAVAHTALTASFLGPEANAQNPVTAGATDAHALEIAAAAIALTVLLIVYRNPATTLLPLCPTVISIMLARSVIARLAHLGLPASSQAVALATTSMLAAGLAQAMFLLSRYHELLRSGAPSDDAVSQALTSMSRPLSASAAMAIFGAAGMMFARLGELSQLGPVLGIAAAIGAMSTFTLLPASITIAGRLGLTPVPRLGPTRLWRLIAVNVVRHPALHLGAAALVMVTLATCIGFIRTDHAAPHGSSTGAADKRYSGIADYVLVQSNRDLRTPQALADLELMAQRVSQVPGVAAVFGVTRPGGQPLPQAKVSYQAAQVGSQLSGAALDIGNAGGELDSLSRGSRLLADTIAKAVATINQVLGTFNGLLAALADLEHRVGGEHALEQLANMGPILDTLRSVGEALGLGQGDQQDSGALLVPIVDGLNGSPACDVNPSCAATRVKLQRLVRPRDSGTSDGPDSLRRVLLEIQSNSDIAGVTHDLQRIADAVITVMRSLGDQAVTALQRQLDTVGIGANGLAQGSQQLATGIQKLVDQTKQLGVGLHQSAAVLNSIGMTAAPSSMAGFNLSPEALASPRIKPIAAMTISPDGRAVRYLVQSSVEPLSRAAADQAGALLSAARSAQPNTSLAEATITLSGTSAVNHDIRDYQRLDTLYVGAVLVLVMLGALIVLLRAVVAPLYVAGLTVTSYLTALGLTNAVTRYVGHQQVSWQVPITALVVLVSVSTGHTLLVIHLIRATSRPGQRFGVVRVMRSTGRILATAGMIATVAMSSLVFGHANPQAQIGFTVATAVVLETTLVRLVMVPALATLAGRASWWPSGILAGRRSQRRHRQAAIAAVQRERVPIAHSIRPIFTRLSRKSFV